MLAPWLAAGKSLTGSTQVIGPVLCRKSLLRSGEANSADAPPAEGAAGNEVEDAHAVEMKKKTLASTPVEVQEREECIEERNTTLGDHDQKTLYRDLVVNEKYSSGYQKVKLSLM